MRIPCIPNESSFCSFKRKNMKKLIGLKILIPFLVLFGIVSCNTDEYYPGDEYYDDLLSDIESLDIRGYTEDLAEMNLDEEWDGEMQRFRGKVRCFEFVFPITLIYPNGDTQEIADKEALREAMRTWKENNPDATERPVLSFPFDVVLKDGSTQTILTEEQLEALKEECHINRPPMPHFKLCFTPVFPITLSFPNGDTQEVLDMEALRTALHNWKLENPDATEKPVIVFPIEIELEDGTVVEVASFDELKEYLKDCVEKMKKKHKKGGKSGGFGGK